MKHFIKTFIPNSIGVFSIRNITWHLLAILLTYIIVASGFDWQYFLSSRGTTLNFFFFPAIVIGGLLPIITPLTCLTYGMYRRNTQLTIVGYALTQAVILGSLISSTYKAFTGRIQPNLHNISLDISHQFNFGILKHGIFWGWPSSHTTIAFAMALTLVTLFSNRKKLGYSAILYALYVGIGVSMSIHWFSEFIAGAIIGSIIGIVVGNSFQKYLSSTQK